MMHLPLKLLSKSLNTVQENHATMNVSVRAPRSSPRTLEQSNFNHLVADIAWFGLALPATTRFLSTYAIHLGADANQLTWLASLPALVLLFSASLSARWMAYFSNSVKATSLPGLGFRLQFLLPALTPLMPHAFQPTWLILSLLIPAIPQGIASVTFLVMFREAVNEKTVPQLLSRRMMALNITVALSGLALGIWLEHVPFPLNYQVMFVVAFLLALVSLKHVVSVRVEPKAAPEVQPTRSEGLSTWGAWRSPLFMTVAFVTGLTHIAFFSMNALIPLHLVNHLGATEGFISQFGVAELAAGAGAAMFAGQIVTKIGNRPMIALAMVGTAISALIIALTPNLYVTLIASAISGASWTMVGIGLFAYFSETTPSENKTVFTTAYTQAIYIAMFVGPIIGTTLNNMGASLVMVLVIGAGLRLAAGVLIHMHPRLWLEKAKQMAWLGR